MEGGAAALEAHRAWWSLLTRSVARLAPGTMLTQRDGDPAPYAGLVAALGPAVRDVALLEERRLSAEWWWLGAICGLLVLEWGSRRLRGAV